LISQQHFLAVIKGVDYNCSGVSQFYLEDRMAILTPPLFTNSGMIFAELEKMTKYWNSTGDFRQTFYVRNICVKSRLCRITLASKAVRLGNNSKGCCVRIQIRDISF